MQNGLIYIAYLVSALLFILALAGLSKQETAQRGCAAGIAGMAVALIASLAGTGSSLAAAVVIFAMTGGAAAGLIVARRVEMTEMPELIACLHSFVGLAAVLVGFNSFLEFGALSGLSAAERNTHLAEIFIGVFIGAVTFTGSVVAFGKLHGTWKLPVFRSAPLALPGGHLLNLAALFGSALLMVWFMAADAPSGAALVLMTLLAGAFGVHLVAAIGGADMPVVISMLNSYSGWAAAGIGFSLENNMLIIAGSLVGSSGAILSYIMCKAMNRSFINVLLGGIGGESSAAGGFEVPFSRESNINVGPRLRMTTLRYIAQALGARLVGTGNLSESTVGYCTKDGDTSCDFALLGAITSVEVVEVGLTMEELPRELVQKTPTDGLSGMSDEEKMGIRYADIHSFIRLGSCGDPETDAKIQRMKNGSAHKRSMPLIINPFDAE